MLSDPTYLSAIRMSLILACGSTLISLVLGVAAAYALFRKALPGSEAITSFLMAPLILPAVVDRRRAPAVFYSTEPACAAASSAC